MLFVGFVRVQHQSGMTLNLNIELLQLSSKDCPAGHEILVTQVKNHSSACSACFYIQRGSFTGLKQGELLAGLEEHHTVREKLLISMRSSWGP